MVDNMFFPPITTFKHHVLTMDWKTIDLMPSLLTTPVLFVTGDQDEIVPTKLTHRLYAAASKNPIRQMCNVKGGTHNDTWIHGYKQYINALSLFFKTASKFSNDLNSNKAKKVLSADALAQGVDKDLLIKGPNVDMKADL